MNNFSPLQINVAEVCSQLEQFIHQQVQQANRAGVVVGLSGGLDSAVVAGLCVRSLGKTRVFALILPERHTPRSAVVHAKQFAIQLGIAYKIIRLTQPLRKLGIYRLIPPTLCIPRKIQERYAQKKHTQFTSEFKQSPFVYSLAGGTNDEMNKSIAFYRSKHRLRMVVCYLYAEKMNYLVAGTANRSEWMTGFFVQYGDSAADFMPILGLYKTQVRQIAEYIQVPKEIIEKPPSPDLLPGITDEYALGIPYTQLDIILFGLEHRWDTSRIAEQANVPPATIAEVNQLVTLSAKWRRLPPAYML
ncbi:MAG: NAD(+) synthase [bacterium]|nr:NAD(+) synthase [bacterium]